MNTLSRRVTSVLAAVSVLTLLGSGTAYAGRPGSALFQQSTPGTYTWTVPKGAMRLEDLPTPTSQQLERHRLRFGPECVDLAAEKRDAPTLRADGKSIPEIARLLRITERAVKTRLRAGATL